MPHRRDPTRSGNDQGPVGSLCGRLRRSRHAKARLLPFEADDSRAWGSAARGEPANRVPAAFGRRSPSGEGATVDSRSMGLPPSCLTAFRSALLVLPAPTPGAWPRRYPLFLAWRPVIRRSTRPGWQPELPTATLECRRRHRARRGSGTFTDKNGSCAPLAQAMSPPSVII